MMGVFATVSSLVQLIVTEEMRGRVMSVYNCAFRGGMPMGNIASGWLIPLFSAPLVLAVNGVLLIVLALFFLLVKRRVATCRRSSKRPWRAFYFPGCNSSRGCQDCVSQPRTAQLWRAHYEAVN